MPSLSPIEIMPWQHRITAKVAAILNISLDEVCRLRMGQLLTDERVNSNSDPDLVEYLSIARATSPERIWAFAPFVPRDVYCKMVANSLHQSQTLYRAYSSELHTPPISSLDFIVLGVPKSATTWLYEMMRAQGVADVSDKEPEYFCGSNYYKGNAWYSGRYQQNNVLLRGDISVGYFYSIESIQRIQAHCRKDIKLIVMLRDPLYRAWSYFCYRLIGGLIPPDFDLCIQDPNYYRLFIKESQYSHYVKAWQSAFPSDNLLFLLQEEVQANQQALIDRVNTFLGADALGSVSHERINKGNAIYWPTLYHELSKIMYQCQYHSGTFSALTSRIGHSIYSLRSLLINNKKIQPPPTISQYFIDDYNFMKSIKNIDIASYWEAPIK